MVTSARKKPSNPRWTKTLRQTLNQEASLLGLIVPEHKQHGQLMMEEVGRLYDIPWRECRGENIRDRMTFCCVAAVQVKVDKRQPEKRNHTHGFDLPIAVGLDQIRLRLKVVCLACIGPNLFCHVPWPQMSHISQGMTCGRGREGSPGASQPSHPRIPAVENEVSPLVFSPFFF